MDTNKSSSNKYKEELLALLQGLEIENIDQLMESGEPDDYFTIGATIASCIKMQARQTEIIENLFAGDIVTPDATTLTTKKSDK